jgi:hypothetical protein
MGSNTRNIALSGQIYAIIGMLCGMFSARSA